MLERLEANEVVGSVRALVGDVPRPRPEFKVFKGPLKNLLHPLNFLRILCQDSPLKGNDYITSKVDLNVPKNEDAVKV